MGFDQPPTKTEWVIGTIVVILITAAALVFMPRLG
jgi:preprotein translocase subunit SecE